MGWEQRARRLRRRRQRRVAAAAVTLAGGQMAWMIAREATPAAALQASRAIELLTECVENIGETCVAGEAAGEVAAVDISADGRYAAVITEEALVDEDDGFSTDVYVIDGSSGDVRWITDEQNPAGGSMFWDEDDNVTSLAISGDGRWVTWVTLDVNNNFFPAAVDPGDTDVDSDFDVYVAAVDVEIDGSSDGDLTSGGHGQPLLASVGPDEANLLNDSFEPTISHDGRFIAFTHIQDGGQPPRPREIVLHDRDVAGDGLFDESGDQSSTIIDPANVTHSDRPDLSADGNFIAFRASDGFISSGDVRVWRRSDGVAFSVTAPDFMNEGDLTSTAARTPSISADGRIVAYEFEAFEGADSDILQVGFSQVIAVTVDPGLGTVLADDPGTPVDEGPRIISRNEEPDLAAAVGDGASQLAVISDDGRYVAFTSNATNFLETSTGERRHVYAVDLLQSALADQLPVLASADTGGAAGDGSSFLPAISGSGRYISFVSSATDLDPSEDIEATPNAFRLEWQVEVEATAPVAPAPESLVFPDTAVSGSSLPQNVTFDTDDFGPWTGSIEFLDGYVDPNLTDYSVVGGCASPTVSFHANDPCVVQVSFTPVQVGNRVAELCLTVTGQSGCSTTRFVGGQAVVPDGIGPLVRESLTDDDVPIVGGEGSMDPAISADGRYVAFTTNEGLDDRDENNLRDVYVRDRLRGTTTLVSVGDGLGVEGHGSFQPRVSGDGRYIVFESSANKVPEPDGEDDGGDTDIFRVDRGAPDPTTGDFVPGGETTTLVSVDVDGGDVGIYDDAVDPSISGDGSQITFTVLRPDPFGSSFSIIPTVLVRNLGPGAPTTVGLSGVLPEGVGNTFQADISADGLHVAFAGRTELGIDSEFVERSNLVYVYDRDVDGDGLLDEPNDPAAPPATRVVQITTGEFTPDGGDELDFRLFPPFESTTSSDPAISGDGSTVAYAFEQTYEQNDDDDPIDDRLTPIPDFDDQIIVADRDPSTGAPVLSEIVSLDGPGDLSKSLFANIADHAGRCLTGGEGCDSSAPDVSDDGRYVVFATRATNLVARPAATLTDGQSCNSGDPCDIVVVDRLAVSNAGGPQHVNEPPPIVRARPLVDPDPPEGPLPPAPVIDRDYGQPVISGDGRFIAFDTDTEYHLGYTVPSSPTNNLIFPIDNNNLFDVFVREWDPVVDPSLAIAFPETQVGTASAPQTAILSTQDFGPAPILAVEILGANPGDFLVASALNCLPPLPGAPPPPAAAVPPVPVHGRVNLKDACQLSVAFRPTAVGVRSATLRVTTGHPFSVPDGGVAAAAAQVTEIQLSGGGAGLGGFSSQPTVDLGSQIVTTTSPEGTITVTNSGNSPFQITNIALGGPNPGDFTIVGTDCIGFLAPGASCTVRVTFTPTAPGERSATLIFTDTAVGGPHLIGLTGRAPTPTLILNPGVVVPGRTAQVQGLNWAPNQVVTITTADANNPASAFAGSTSITANGFGVIDGSLLFFPKTTTGPRIVIATGTPNTLSAFQPLLVSTATINGVDFVSRG